MSRATAAPGRVLRFRTETGSTYEIDGDAGTWRRLGTTMASGRLRTEGGWLLARPEIVVGSSAVVAFAVDESPVPRVLITSRVVAIETSPLRRRPSQAARMAGQSGGACRPNSSQSGASVPRVQASRKRRQSAGRMR